ncbi:MAG: polysaccharide biosynthesis/export family protein [Gemmatimonadota bacterium]
MRELLATLIALLVVGSLARAQSPVTDATDSSLVQGDLVKITVWQRDELSGEFEVDGDGSLIHPLYQEVIVTGIPSERIEERVERYLVTLEAQPQFVVQPLHQVAITGMVVKPDIYHLPTGTSVAEAVAQAGGVSMDGKADEVRLVRAGSVTTIDLTEPDSPGPNMLVQSGDQIMVERQREGAFRRIILPVLGAVGSVASIINLTTR